jgi:hypothetical protein
MKRVEPMITNHKVVSREEWVAARKRRRSAKDNN